ncbi:M4 family metallopeptidase [Rhodanobacter sp. AS-Z3]|uniref:M4 family metallopeptidase n=1 Tax=Rhodanobacter sp. AS-Z3 TaxID=3031330 RepID=UPI002478CA52|nr:M4 family metallopeptidase [Rhodanobacter sp. AS-Z3]WEN15308.1 M4 family metallopeptidase [Rhodanobacter sp. AS-Z3]
MLNKKLAGALLAILGGAAAPLCMAAAKVDIQARALGPVASSALASRLGLGSGSTFVAERQHRTARGTLKSRERQDYRGVPVYGRSLVVERNTRGSVLSVTGAAERDLGASLASVQPRLSAVLAQRALHQHMGDAALQTRNVDSKLFVYPQDGGVARLVYRVSYVVDNHGRLSRPTAIIDANTGAVLKQWNGLTDGRRPPGGSTMPVAVAATGPGGNELTGLYHYDNSGPGRELLSAQRVGNTCYLQNDEVATYNLAGGQRVTQWAFGCAGSNPAQWNSFGDAINGAFSPINDAHHFGGVVYDMYNNWFGTPPLQNGDGSPMRLSMWVHYGTHYENAFWDGSEMVFGDGDEYFYPFVVLDITGHEISHGFTEQHSGLEYTGQSGGMNEAFSDMAGEAVKFYDRGSNDFMVGADIVKPATVPLLGMAALRDMCTPSNDGASIDNAAQYNDSLDVHYTSGVYNRAFCNLATSHGWDTKMAFEVFHDANALYWAPNETFNGGACGVEQAAVDRSYAEADVAAAFAEVGVTCDSAPR